MLCMNKTVEIKIHAPFYLHGVWSWQTWTCQESNLRAACADKATELGAKMWDASQASMMINGTCVEGHPTVFS